MLTALGFGPDTALMNDPKLFVDGRFLASLLVELRDELGEQDAHLALFQIGLYHGLRDAVRLCRQHDDAISDAGFEGRDTTAMVLRYRATNRAAKGGGPAFTGRWPERHEAVARCSRLGPAEHPACWLSAGYTSGWLSGTLDRTLIARELECGARGDACCRFEVRDAADWQGIDDPQLQWLLGEVSVDAFRKLAAQPPIERSAQPPSPEDLADGRFDRNQPVVHIWGPVMVLPFTTFDEALGTMDMLGRDPGISEIRAVVVDLRERPLDEGFGAAALEQVLESIESWDAQGLITGVSAESEAAMASLEASHLVLRKDLPEAIATAFQIADAQRHQL
jgi:hypothetical protein